VRRIFSDYEGYENLPEYSVSDNGVIVTLYNRNYKNVGNNVIKKDTKKKSAQDRRQNILGLMIDDSKITIPQLSKKINVSTKTIERDIEKLKEENKIYRQGNSRDGTWIVLE
jgi:hypothetical protein